MKKLLLLLLLAGFIFTGCKNDVGNGENDSVPYDEPEGEVYTIEGPGTDDDLTIMVKIDNQFNPKGEYPNPVNIFEAYGFWNVRCGIAHDDYPESTSGSQPHCDGPVKLDSKTTIVYNKIPHFYNLYLSGIWFYGSPGGYYIDLVQNNYGIRDEDYCNISELLKEINERKYGKNIFSIVISRHYTGEEIIYPDGFVGLPYYLKHSIYFNGKLICTRYE